MFLIIYNSLNSTWFSCLLAGWVTLSLAGLAQTWLDSAVLASSRCTEQLRFAVMRGLGWQGIRSDQGEHGGVLLAQTFSNISQTDPFIWVGMVFFRYQMWYLHHIWIHLVCPTFVQNSTFVCHRLRWTGARVWRFPDVTVLQAALATWNTRWHGKDVTMLAKPPPCLSCGPPQSIVNHDDRLVIVFTVCSWYLHVFFQNRCRLVYVWLCMYVLCLFQIWHLLLARQLSLRFNACEVVCLAPLQPMVTRGYGWFQWWLSGALLGKGMQ